MRGGRNNQFFRTSGPIGRIWLKVSSVQNGFSQMAIVMRHDASLAYDPAYDAERWGAGNLAFSSDLRQQAFAIEAVPWPLSGQAQLVPLVLQLSETQQLQLGLDSLSGIDQAMRIVLEDRLAGQFYDLRTDSLRLQLSAGLYRNRFFLHLGEGSSVAVPNSQQADIRVFASEGMLYVQRAAGSQLEIYNAAGQLCAKHEVQTADFKASLPEGRGIYLIRIFNKQGLHHRKVYR
jgi:hypothetical protein